MADALFVSPHFDDVAFSCGGLVCRHLDRGERATVVTVFGGAPGEGVVPFDPSLVAAVPAASPDPAVALRQLWSLRVEEDRAAMRVLGSAWSHEGFPEAAFRPEVTGWREIWRAPSLASRPWVDAIVARLAASISAETIVYAPLAVGSHIDHAMCFLAASALRRRGVRILYYEDVPYATRAGALDRRIADLEDDLVASTIDVTPHLTRRIEAASCYRSQVVGAFGGADRVASTLTAFASARAVAPATFAERVWEPT